MLNNTLYISSFLKVGHSPGICNGGYKSETESDEDEKPGSWRQAIFNTVVTPSKTTAPCKLIFLLSLGSNCLKDLFQQLKKFNSKQIYQKYSMLWR